MDKTPSQPPRTTLQLDVISVVITIAVVVCVVVAANVTGTPGG
jgi:hypothetical protein